MQKKTRRIIGWVFTAIPLLALFVTMLMKFFSTSYQEQFTKSAPMLWPAQAFGVVILIILVLYFIPRTQVLAFSLCSAYYAAAGALTWNGMGLAFAMMPFGLLILLWIGQAFLRPSMLRAGSD